MWSWIACYVNGHDYSICCESGSMFLRCVHCGRRSQGWVVHHHDRPVEHAVDGTHAVNSVSPVNVATTANA